MYDESQKYKKLISNPILMASSAYFYFIIIFVSKQVPIKDSSKMYREANKVLASNGRLYEFIRFGIVGVIATAIHYIVYWVLLKLFSVNVNISYTIGYIISFVCNFFLSARFTFKEKTSAKRGLGFGIAHLVNYLLQLFFLNIFIGLGVKKLYAPIPVYCICIPLNFLLVRFVFKKIKMKKSN